VTTWAALAIFGAGIIAGAMNVIVGAGSLVTFPTLLALGYPPVLANVSNNVGLTPGNFSGVVTYRKELEGQRNRLLRLGSMSLLGGITGAVLLLALPEKVFASIVPLLIAFAACLMAVQPRLKAWMQARSEGERHGGITLMVGVFLSGVYGGYFGAAQGVLLMALMAVFLDDSLQKLNGVKNGLAFIVNGVAALVFISTTSIAWPVTALIAAGTLIGGLIGGHWGRLIPDRVLRWCIVVVGLSVAVILEFGLL